VAASGTFVCAARGGGREKGEEGGEREPRWGGANPTGR